MKFPVTSKFNAQESFRENTHVGIDFAFPKDSPLYSIQDGVVSRILTAEDKSSLGNAIFIKLKDGHELVYAHLNKIYLNVGDVVKTNQIIGLSGNSGNVHSSTNSGGFHLHLGLKDINGNWINPEHYIPLVQNMGNNIAQFSGNIHKLDAADMLQKALESLSDMAINFINFL